MKLSFILMFFVCLSASANINVMSQKVTVDFKNAELQDVFRSLTEQTGYGIIYSFDKLRPDQTKVSVNLENVELSVVMTELLKGVPYTYTIKDQSILIIPATEKAVQQQQKRTVTGLVRDENGAGMAGVSVVVKGTLSGVATDVNGRYLLQYDPQYTTLEISYIGYKKVTVQIGNRSEINIALEPETLSIEDVVVTGYQTLSKERATGSFSKPNRELFDNRITSDLLSRLQGITSGLVFNINPSTNEPYMEVRGRSTIFANASPLIVIDNFPYEGNLSDINPNDVENVTILKDAAAASIWGVRASNGVIVLTTKKGKPNNPLNVNFTSNFTISQKPNLFYDPASLNSSSFIEAEKLLFSKGLYDQDILESDPSNFFGNYSPVSPVVGILEKERLGLISSEQANDQIKALAGSDVRKDLKKYFYQNSLNQQYNININGGADKITYFISGGYDNNRGVQKGNEVSRITFNTLNTFTPVKNLQITTGINYTKTDYESDNTLAQINMGGPKAGAIYPYARLADDSGNPLTIVKDYQYEFARQASSKGFQDLLFSPLEELRNKWNTSTTKRNEAKINTSLKYNLTERLSAEVSYQYRKMNSDSRTLRTKESYYVRNQITSFASVDDMGNFTGSAIPEGGILNIITANQTSNYWKGQLNYDGSWDKHSVSAIAGAEQMESKYSYLSTGLYGYDPATGTQQIVDYSISQQAYPNRDFTSINNYNYETGNLDRFRSYYANGSYTYNYKYTLSASVRADASNFFGVETNKKIVPLWSVGGKWNIDKESFYKVSWLPTLKFRATYGYNGNIDRSVTSFTTIYTISSTLLLPDVKAAMIRNPANDQLGWEKHNMLNLGIDFGISNNILSGNIDYYWRKGNDLMGDDLLAPSAGFVNPNTGTISYRGNFSATEGRGVDVVLNSINIDRDFRWTTNFLFSHATTKVTRFDVENKPLSLIEKGNGTSSFDETIITPQLGRPVFGVYSLRWGGLDPETGDPRGYLDGELSTDYQSLLSPDSVDDLVYHGSGRPTVFGGMTNTLSFKQLSLSFNISYKFGYSFRRSSINYRSLLSNRGHSDYEKRWQKPGDELITDIPSIPDDISGASNREYFYQLSSALVEKGDHIRLQDVSLSYRITKQQWGRLPFKDLRINLYVNNVGIIWRANDKGLDPDVYFGYPAPRTFALGIKASF